MPIRRRRFAPGIRARDAVAAIFSLRRRSEMLRHPDHVYYRQRDD